MQVIYKGLILIILGLSVFSITPLSAQDTTKTYKKHKNNDILKRMDFGGYLSVLFGDVTYIEVSPLASYRITEKFHAGIGLTYMYYSYNDPYFKYSSSAYGGSVFARYFIWRDLFAHVEYAPLYITNFIYPANIPPTVDKAPWAQDIFIGGGYRQWVGGRMYINLMLLFNVNETIYSPYSNPIIRIGFGIGL